MNTNFLPDTALANMIKSKLSNISISRGWASTSEVAYILGVSERTILRWHQESKIKNAVLSAIISVINTDIYYQMCMNII